MNTIINIEQMPSEKAMLSRLSAYYKELQKPQETKSTSQPSSKDLAGSQDESE